MKQVLYWTPRVLGICIAGFVSIFALDVFGEGYTFWETVTALLIHLVPTCIVVVALVLAWRWEWVGALLFTSLSVFYVVLAWGQFPWVTYLVISGPLFVTGVLFLLNWVFRKQVRGAKATA